MQMHNADLDNKDHLPPPPKVIKVDNVNKDSPLSPVLCPSCNHIPKIEPDTSLSSIPTPVYPPVMPSPPMGHCYPQLVQAPPQRFDSYHLFTTIAEETKYPTFPHTNTQGQKVDLAVKDTSIIAHVCHYLMMHTAIKLFGWKRKLMVSRPAPRNSLTVAMRQSWKNSPSFTPSNVSDPRIIPV